MVESNSLSNIHIFVMSFLAVGLIKFPVMPSSTRIDHFTVVGFVTWPLNGSESGVDLIWIQTSLLLLCKSSCSYAK